MFQVCWSESSESFYTGSLDRSVCRFSLNGEETMRFQSKHKIQDMAVWKDRLSACVRVCAFEISSSDSLSVISVCRAVSLMPGYSLSYQKERARERTGSRKREEVPGDISLSCVSSFYLSLLIARNVAFPWHFYFQPSLCMLVSLTCFVS